MLVKVEVSKVLTGCPSPGISIIHRLGEAIYYNVKPNHRPPPTNHVIFDALDSSEDWELNHRLASAGRANRRMQSRKNTARITGIHLR